MTQAVIYFSGCAGLPGRSFSAETRRTGWLVSWPGKGKEKVRPVLYQLPQVLEAVKAGKTIYIVEGEKDANNLAALGLVATTEPYGVL